MTKKIDPPLVEILSKKQMLALRVGFLCIFLLGIFLGYYIAFLVIPNQIHQQYQSDLDIYFQKSFENKIAVQGRLESAIIVQQLRNRENDIPKLNLFADYVINNFNNPFWGDSEIFYINNCSISPPLNHKYFANYCSGYGYDKLGGLRSRSSNLSSEPYWISYQKTGACQESAIFFANLTNQSGFVSRVVHSPDKDHQWAEVLLNEKWCYFDIDLYRNSAGNISYQNDWVNCDRKKFRETLGGWNFGKVTVFNNSINGIEEDITSDYTEIGTLSLIINNPVSKIAITPKEKSVLMWENTTLCGQFPCVIKTNFGKDTDLVVYTQTELSPYYLPKATFTIKENLISLIIINEPTRLDNSHIMSTISLKNTIIPRLTT